MVFTPKADGLLVSKYFTRGVRVCAMDPPAPPLSPLVRLLLMALMVVVLCPACLFCQLMGSSIFMEGGALAW